MTGADHCTNDVIVPHAAPSTQHRMSLTLGTDDAVNMCITLAVALWDCALLHVPPPGMRHDACRRTQVEAVHEHGTTSLAGAQHPLSTPAGETTAFAHILHLSTRQLVLCGTPRSAAYSKRCALSNAGAGVPRARRHRHGRAHDTSHSSSQPSGSTRLALVRSPARRLWHAMQRCHTEHDARYRTQASGVPQARQEGNGGPRRASTAPRRQPVAWRSHTYVALVCSTGVCLTC